MYNQPRYFRFDPELFKRIAEQAKRQKRTIVAQLELYAERGVEQDEQTEQTAQPAKKGQTK